MELNLKFVELPEFVGLSLEKPSALGNLESMLLKYHLTTITTLRTINTIPSLQLLLPNNLNN